MWQELLKGRLFGHPIHVMLVHFPTALFPAGFLFDIGGIVFNEPSLFVASFYVILLGVATGLLAGVFGFVDYIKLGTLPNIFRIASWHAGIQFFVLMIFGVIAGIKFQTYPDPEAPSSLLLVIMGMSLATMLVGNHLGGELVFGHGVGVKENESK